MKFITEDFCRNVVFSILNVRCWAPKAMPQLEQGQLKALPAAPGVADAAAPSGPNAHLMNSHAEVKQSLEKFTDSLHQKAVQVTGWLAAIDRESSARAAALLAHNFL